MRESKINLLRIESEWLHLFYQNFLCRIEMGNFNNPWSECQWKERKETVLHETYSGNVHMLLEGIFDRGARPTAVKIAQKIHFALFLTTTVVWSLDSQRKAEQQVNHNANCTNPRMCRLMIQLLWHLSLFEILREARFLNYQENDLAFYERERKTPWPFLDSSLGSCDGSDALHSIWSTACHAVHSLLSCRLNILSCVSRGAGHRLPFSFQKPRQFGTPSPSYPNQILSTFPVRILYSALPTRMNTLADFDPIKSSWNDLMKLNNLNSSLGKEWFLFFSLYEAKSQARYAHWIVSRTMAILPHTGAYSRASWVLQTTFR